MAPKKKETPVTVDTLAPEVDDKKAPEKEFAKEELLPILDSLLNNGYATMDFKLRNVPIVVRTRFAWEEQLIYKKVESSASSPILFQRNYTLMTLAASLVQFAGHLFEPINAAPKDAPTALEDSFNDRYEFVQSLNSVFIDIMEKKLFEFDEKQNYITKHFDELLSDF